MRKLLLAAPALALISVTAAAAPKRDRVPAATPVGKPVTCIQLSQIRESQVRSDRVIDFRATGKRWYRVTLPQSCPGLGFEKRFSYQTSLNQLCSADIITVLQQAPVMRGASCGLAPFQPVTIARR